ncbi:hypothetical protein ACFXPN_06595 [Streptomyces griseorubiginosus]|uniref:hypothetical protein n=1 Tax=Streptomyces griseorubiginosus TaxID=67304 RepID=UPI0036C92DCE
MILQALDDLHNQGPLALSCVSVLPSMVAMMLAQLDPQPGDRILEIGASTGSNAALLAEFVGPDGQINTIDIDPGVALHARQVLNRTGYEHVRVMERDGLKGAPEWPPTPAWSPRRPLGRPRPVLAATRRRRPTRPRALLARPRT